MNPAARPRLAEALLPGTTRPVVVGEYPYYRAHPDNWAANLRELRSLGVDVVSCYLPWRFHETGEDTDRSFDFTGATDPQRNVVGLLELAAAAGLRVLLKPGPFIHAEVQLGGLPDRLCGPAHTPYTGLDGAVLTSQGKPLPSLLDAAVRAETETWLKAVADEVVAKAAAPAGPVVALQLGNEGTCGDAHLPVDAQDASPAAREAFARWLTGRGLSDEAFLAAADVTRWTSALRRLWSQWSGHAIVELWDQISALFPSGPARLANVPLTAITAPRAALDAWAARQRAIRGSRHLVGHTEWVGNPARDPAAFGSHLAGILLGDTDVVEANWGFTWTDASFARPATPVFNALLALMLGSTTVSVYTACATENWGPLVDMDPDGLRSEGVDPALHAPPYSPGAPLAETAGHQANAAGLRLLAAFLERFGDLLLAGTPDRDGVVLVDRTLPEAGAWQRTGRTPLAELADAVHRQLAGSGRQIGLGWLDEHTAAAPADSPVPVAVLRAGHPGSDRPGELTLPAAEPADGEVAAFVADFAAGLPAPQGAHWRTEQGRARVLSRSGPDGVRIIGAFNPTDGEDRITGTTTGTTGGADWTLRLPAGAAAVAVARGLPPAGPAPRPSPMPSRQPVAPGPRDSSHERDGAMQPTTPAAPGPESAPGPASAHAPDPAPAPDPAQAGGPVPHLRPAGPQTLAVLDDLISRERPVFAMPSWFVTAESAQAGHLVSEFVRELGGRPPGTAYRSFFANSRYEALHGAVKLLRHRAAATAAHHRGRVLVLDPDGTLARRADPLGEGPDRALAPGLITHATVDGLRAALRGTAVCGLVVRAPERLDGAALTAVAETARRARATGARIVVDLSDLDPSTPTDPAVTALRPDLVVLGESLTGHEVPFGAFTGTPDTFAPWSTPQTGFLHSNTYGGNTVAMRAVIARLLPRWDDAAPVHRVLAAAAADRAATLDLYARHVNPMAARMQRKLHGALNVVRAKGSRITVRLDSGRELDLVDGLCGAGLGVAGHNPADALGDVVRAHDPAARDHVRELERALAEETGLPRTFPAVSGASAVESAITLARLARPRQRRIVVFKHNYGGKTLVSLLATAAERTRAPFGPLYDDIRYIDPFTPHAVDEFRAEAAAGNIGLVWIELVHGSSDAYGPIPGPLLDAVTEGRTEHGYLVGVDEVLTSYYRCGTRFAHHGRLPDIDLMSLSKALSYGCFPTGAALVSEEVYEAARRTNPRLVEELRTHHAHALGAHFALQAISRVDAIGLPERVRALSDTVRSGIAALDTGPQGVVGRRFAEGLLGRLEPRVPGPLARFVDPQGEAMTYALILWWITRARAFVVYDVFLLPLTATEREVRHVMRGARRLSRTGPARLLAHAALFRLGQRLSRALSRTPTPPRSTP
ncbi:aminotransferase class III-fold pyridoxal phosphate-dependent enzyme [Streptomyces sp. NPDC127106]|uniref:aminotransferase class III-fold pyridoxal phosphate-dependent enzyme n=1 Tax=Streptomyces sp. NPDC127106 TaxID=3345360 RepID=UPI003626976E